MNNKENFIYAITGYTSNCGTWQPEIFQNLKDAQVTFKYYVKEYNATSNYTQKDGLYSAECEKGNFRIYKCKIK